ncbi:jg20403, partial [Pararge aegeria aegeria]
RSESAHELHRHRWRHGRISVSRTSHMQITHSEPPSSVSSSALGWCTNNGHLVVAQLL